MKSSKWEAKYWYCPNCGKPNAGYENDSGEVKVTCSKCRCVMVATFKKKYSNIKIINNKSA